MISRTIDSSRSRSGVSLMETVVAAGVASVVFAVLISASIGLKQSMTATDQYVTQLNNGNRLADAVSRDLRFAVRVGSLNNGTYTRLYNFASFTVTETNTLVITVPDYYGSNTPNNTSNSTFKTSRYSRASLGTGVVPWTDAVSDPTSMTPPLRFAGASAASDEMQIRYYRKQRSASDKTVCFYRAEYPAGAVNPSSVREIAEQIVDASSTTSLILSDPDRLLPSNSGKHFRIQSYFTPRYRLRNVSASATTSQYVDVSLRNDRRDIP